VEQLPVNESDVEVIEEEAESLARAMASAWHRGERPVAEEVLSRHPEVAGCPEAAVRLIYEEILLRREHGETPDESETLDRFPRWRAELAILLACDRLVEPGDLATSSSKPKAQPAWPEVGTRLGGFRLIANLGSGTIGRTYLASDPDLADRPVVLKLTARGLAEHVTLARLQHTNVVPLYAAPEFPERHLRALCMPYLGGTSLDRVLAEIRRRGGGRPTGESIVEAIDRVQAKVPVQVRSVGPARRYLADVSYAEAMAWIAARLADALQDAHDRGLVHMDVKAANVLIAADGTPMLLDFHLAREPVRPDGPPPAWIGGTPHSMAPEQRAAMDAVREQRPIIVGVDGRADIYALGRLMDEAFAIPRGNEDVSPGLRAIIDRCIAEDPRDRYPHASGLADDLRLHLKNEPLRGVPNRSLRERWAKWRKRSPYALSRSAFLASMLAAMLGVASYGRQRLDAAEAALFQARGQLLGHHYDEAMRSANEGLALAWIWPTGDATRHALGDIRDLTQRAHSAQELHSIVEMLRFVCGADIRSSQLDSLRRLPRLGDLWESRRALARSGRLALDTDLTRQISDDLRDLATLGASLGVMLASDPAAKAEAHRQALTYLADASSLLGPSRALAEACKFHAQALGLTNQAADATKVAASLPLDTAADHHALGLAKLQAGDLVAALAAFDRAVELDPNGFWNNFHHGATAYRLGHFADAVADFRACITLAPKSADCYYDRALAYSALNQSDRALRDYEHALRLKPDFVDASLNIGLIHYHRKQYRDAETSLQNALRLQPRSPIVHYNLALVRLAQGDREGCLENLKAASGLPQAEELRNRLLREDKARNGR
jgi:serine/threonine protein kinase/Flp pilus assembly protein TadD